MGLASFMGRRYLDSGKVMPSGALALVSIAFALCLRQEAGELHRALSENPTAAAAPSMAG